VHDSWIERVSGGFGGHAGSSAGGDGGNGGGSCTQPADAGEGGQAYGLLIIGNSTSDARHNTIDKVPQKFAN
jgi:hypothetical protein